MSIRLGRVGRHAEAVGAYRRALALTRNDVEHAFCEGRLARLDDHGL